MTILAVKIEEWDLEKIDDNPYNPRLFYKPQKVTEKAQSIKTNGLLQRPKARVVGDRVQLAFGGYRFRAFRRLHKENPKEYKTMPLEIEVLTDEQMVIFALEENLKRDDNTPIEIARIVEAYFSHFLGMTEVRLAEKLSMSQGHISNMRRVLTLPESVLEKIDEGRISFTMGRELLLLKGLHAGTYSEWSGKEGRNVVRQRDDENLMLEAIKEIVVPGGVDRYATKQASTVEGMQRGIYSVVSRHFRPLEKETKSYHYTNKILFDSRATGCLKCHKMVLVRPTKSGAEHYCTDEKCWDKNQKAHQERIAAEAMAKRQADLQKIALEQAAKAPEEKRETPKPKEVAPSPPAPAEVSEVSEEELRKAQDVSDREFAEKARNANRIRHMPLGYPCKTCVKCMACDRASVRSGEGEEEGQLVCRNQITRHTLQASKVVVPEDLREAVESAGTRGQVIDLRGLWTSNYNRQEATGYVGLDGILKEMEDPEECTERCTRGFHYAFDSSDRDPKTYQVCSDKKCVGKKKSAYTRARNAKNNEKKNAERAAFKEAVAATTTLDRPRMKLIIYSQIHGSHSGSYSSWGRNDQLDWLAGRLKVETKGDNKAKEAALWKKVDALTDQEIARLIVNFMLNMITYRGAKVLTFSDGWYGSNREHQDYKIVTTDVLNWMGVGVTTKKPEKKVAP